MKDVKSLFYPVSYCLIMTLILTELSEHGVAMAADTALTKLPNRRDGKYEVTYDVVKLHPPNCIP